MRSKKITCEEVLPGFSLCENALKRQCVLSVAMVRCLSEWLSGEGVLFSQKSRLSA